jgi:hypothetical protein
VININQQIGIQFAATGMESINKAVKAIKTQLVDLQSFMKGLNLGGVDKIATSLTQAATAMGKMSAASAGIQRTAGAILTLATATETLVRAQSGLRNFSQAVGTAPRNAGAAATTSTGPTQHSGPPSATVGSAPPPQGHGETFPVPVTGFRGGGGRWFAHGPMSLPQHSSQRMLPPGMGWGRGNGDGAIHLTQGPDGTYSRGNYVGGRYPNYDYAVGAKHKRTGDGKSWLGQFGTDTAAAMYTTARYGVGAGVLYGAYRGAKYGVTGILGGGARQKIVEENRRLYSNDMSQEEVAEVSQAGRQFSAKYPWVNVPDYIKGTSESGSYFPNMPKKFWRSNTERSFQLQTLGQMKDPIQANRMLNDTLMLQLNKLPAKEKQDALSGKNNVLSQMQDKTTAMLGKAFEISPIWAQDWSDYQKYALATEMNKGMPLSYAIARLGAMRPGYRASTLGRGDARLFTKEATTFAKLNLAAQNPKFDSLKPKQQKTQVNSITNEIQGKLQNDPSAVLTQAWRDVQELKARGVNDPFTKYGVSQHFRSAFESTIEPSMNEDIKLKQTQLEGATISGQVGKISNNLSDITTGMQLLGTAATNLSTSLATTYNAFDKFQSLADAINAKTKRNDEETALSKKIEQYDKRYPLFDPNAKQDPMERYGEVSYMRGRGDPDDLVSKYMRHTDPRRKQNPWSSQFADDTQTVADKVRFPGMGFVGDLVKDYNPLNYVTKGLAWAMPDVFGNNAEKKRVDNFVDSPPSAPATPAMGTQFFTEQLSNGGGAAKDFASACQEAANKIRNMKIDAPTATSGKEGASQTGADQGLLSPHQNKR